jgi:hypothetical protein
MIDFSAVRSGQMKITELQAQFTREDLIHETNDMIDTQLGLIEGATDAYVTFEPTDPQAHDPYAATEDEIYMGWTLGHVIVHATASGEESTALAAALARGVEVTWRSRYETLWTTIHRADQLTQRLEESRRMRLAYLDTWPDDPYLNNLWHKMEAKYGVMNAIGRVLFGLKHDSDHLGQIAEIMRQARDAFGH